MRRADLVGVLAEEYFSKTRHKCAHCVALPCFHTTTQMEAFPAACVPAVRVHVGWVPCLQVERGRIAVLWLRRQVGAVNRRVPFAEPYGPSCMLVSWVYQLGACVDSSTGARDRLPSIPFASYQRGQ